MSGDTARRLAEVLGRYWEGPVPDWAVEEFLPIVQREGALRAAEELADAANQWQHLTDGAGPVAKFLRARAAALRGEAGR